MVKVKINLAPGAIMPQYAHTGDSGADLFSMVDYTISPGETATLGTGVTLELPAGYEAQVRSKSGLAANQSLSVLNSPGTVDNSYRGEVKVILHNSGSIYQRISKGQKIAQLIVAPYVQAEFCTDTVLTETDRGAGGLGSTGLDAKPVPFPPVTQPVFPPGHSVPTYATYPEDGRRIERDREEGWEQQ